MKKDKEFLKPEAEIVEFHSEDVIVTSDWWGGGNDVGGGSGGNVPGN